MIFNTIFLNLRFQCTQTIKAAELMNPILVHFSVCACVFDLLSKNKPFSLKINFIEQHIYIYIPLSTAIFWANS